MYYRIKNRLDADIVSADILSAYSGRKIVADRIIEAIDILDDAYGSHRGAHAMGGYILYFPDSNSYNRDIQRICDFYKFIPDGYEYTDVLGMDEKEGVEWHEELFLLSSDDSLVLIHPQEVCDGKAANV